MKLSLLVVLGLSALVPASLATDENLLERLLSKLQERDDDIPPSPQEDTGPPLETDGGSDDQGRELDLGFDHPLMIEDIGSPLETRELNMRDLMTRGGASPIRTFDYFEDGKKVTKNIKDLCLEAHNTVRALHKNTPNVGWNNKLAQQAEEFALELAEADTLYHDTPGGGVSHTGENLFSGLNALQAKNTPEQAVFRWYQECWDPKNYDYSTNSYSEVTGHFTQVVWKGTKKIGCGAASTSWVSGPFTWTKTIIVCRYTSGGNMSGKFKTNVEPLKSGQSVFKPPLQSLYPGKPKCVDLSNSMCKPSWCGVVGNCCGCACPGT